MSNNTLRSKTIVCEEVFDENSTPSDEEVIDYAKKIGIDPSCEPHLLPIALNGLMQPLPDGWKPCFDAAIKRWYYYNKNTSTSQWEHPLDDFFRGLVKKGRSEGYSSAAEDDSKTAAKEELKSFDEVSDLLSSKSNELKLESPRFEMNELDKGKEHHPRVHHQPLLLRRKQLQSSPGSTPFSSLQVAKALNNTMRENSLLELGTTNIVTEHRTFRVSSANIGDSMTRYSNSNNTSKQLQPLRRAQTLDPIPTFVSSNTKSDGPPIKGILRESSFSGLPNRNTARLNPIQGDVQSTQDSEDEKKRSVRFADFEHKSLDVRFHYSDSDRSLSEEEREATGTSSPEEEDQGHLLLNSRNELVNKGRPKGYQNSIKDLVEEQMSNQVNIDIGSKNKISEKIINTQALVSPLVMSAIVNASEEESDGSNDNKEPNVEQLSFSDHSGNVNISREDAQVKSPEIYKRINSFLTHSYSQQSLVDKLNVYSEENALTEHKSGPNSPIFSGQNKKTLDPEIVSLRDAIQNMVGLENHGKLSELEDFAKRKSNLKLLALEDKIEREMQDKIAVMKKQKSENLKQVSEHFLQQEKEQQVRLADETSKKLSLLKNCLDEKLKENEQELRAQYEKEIDVMVLKLEEEKNARISEIRALHDSVLMSNLKEEEERFNSEKLKLELESKSELQKQQQIIQKQIDILKIEEDQQINAIKNECLLRIEEVKNFFQSQTIVAEQKYEIEIKKIEEEFNSKLEALRNEKEAELRRVQTEWDDKVTATTLQQKAIIESATMDHEKNMVALRLHFQKEEEELKRNHAEQIETWFSKLKKLNDKEPNSLTLNREFEKVRCEKRLLEDKYRSLKDKYLQLKSDIETAVERKLQRARRKKEDLSLLRDQLDDKDAKSNSKGKNNNPEPEEEKQTKPRVPILPPFTTASDQLNIQEVVENDPSSDDQYTLSLSIPTDEQRYRNISPNRSERDKKKKLSRGKLRLEHKKDLQGNVLDDVRSQLQELENIEDLIPVNSQGDTYLRYPFRGPVLWGTSAEVDFYRHRVIVEQEAVHAAKECLLQQKKELEVRQSTLRTNNNSSTMQQLQQQERDLTEMEVSLHRTRALLGEKMIRLRLLGDTLNRIVEDSPNNANTQADAIQPSTGGLTGFPAETVPFNVVQNLENINSEIREIWSQLNKQQSDAKGVPEVNSIKTMFTKPPSNKSAHQFRRVPSNRAEIEGRLKGLRDWLQKPAPNNTDWNQLTI